MKMRPLGLDSIEDGYFRTACHDAIERMQAELVAHVDRYGLVTKGAKAKVRMEVELSVVGFDDDGPEKPTFAVKTRVKYAPAPRPERTSLARKLATKGGEVRLFVEQPALPFAGEEHDAEPTGNADDQEAA